MSMTYWKKNKIQQFKTLIFCLSILSQNAVDSPVLCFESDGHINVEADCDIRCEIPKPKNDEHQDDCDNCFDIHLWNYNPDLYFLTQTFHIGNVEFDITQIFISQESIREVTSEFQSLENLQLPFPPFIKNTILLI